MSNPGKYKGKIQPKWRPSSIPWQAKRLRQHARCTICGSNHLDIFFCYFSKRSRKLHLAYEVAKTRPKSHPRRDKRGQSKPR